MKKLISLLLAAALLVAAIGISASAFGGDLAATGAGDLFVVADGVAYEADQGDIFEYIFYLNVGAKVYSLDARLKYDSAGIEPYYVDPDDPEEMLEPEEFFPKIRNSIVLNSIKPGLFKFNFSAANGKKFDTDETELIHARFKVTAEKGVYNIWTEFVTLAGANEYTYVLEGVVKDKPKRFESYVPGREPYQGTLPTEPPTEPPTEEPTEAPTAEPTQAPTEEPTQEPTQAPTEAPTAPIIIKVGDMNGDGQVNNRDAMILDRFVAGWAGYDSFILDMDAADINNDGQVNNRDAMIMDRFVAGWNGYDRYFA